MAVSGVLGKWNLSRIQVACQPPAEIYDGLQTLLSIELTNRRRWLPLFLMEVSLDGRKVLFPLVEPGTGQRRNLPAVLLGRGEHAPPELLLRSRFPINFFIREQRLSTDRPLTVFPRPEPCGNPEQADPGAARGARSTSLKGQSGDISRIRDYLGGEPLKLIHWKLSARHDQLKVKELSAASRPPITLDLRTLPGQDLEQRLRCAAWLVTRMLRSGQAVGLCTGDMTISPDHSQQHRLLLLETLAFYGQHQTTA